MSMEAQCTVHCSAAVSNNAFVNKMPKMHCAMMGLASLAHWRSLVNISDVYARYSAMTRAGRINRFTDRVLCRVYYRVLEYSSV